MSQPAPVCVYCKLASEWRRYPGRKGWAVTAWCRRCDRCATPERVWYPARMFQPHEVESFARHPVPDYVERKTYCGVCGVLGEVELHHLAPRAYFGAMAELWPKINLCHRCHMEWHDKVTPGLVGKKRKNSSQPQPAAVAPDAEEER